jgi:hypothetical protein
LLATIRTRARRGKKKMVSGETTLISDPQQETQPIEIAQQLGEIKT